MSIYAISDLHGFLPEPPGDATSLIIVGDICPDYIQTRFDSHYRERVIKGQPQQARWLDTQFREWAEDIGVPIYATWGNHDFVGEKRSLWPEIHNVTWAVDELVDVEGLKVWFHPWVPRLDFWAFYADDLLLEGKTKAIPQGIDVLASHGPPRGHCDGIPPGTRFNAMGSEVNHVGDDVLLEALADIQPRLTLCGHIHEGRGESTTSTGQLIVNVAAVNEYYVLCADPWVDLTPYL
jgi:Icc-related predicted phosphoesterase